MVRMMQLSGVDMQKGPTKVGPFHILLTVSEC